MFLPFSKKFILLVLHLPMAQLVAPWSHFQSYRQYRSAEIIAIEGGQAEFSEAKEFSNTLALVEGGSKRDDIHILES